MLQRWFGCPDLVEWTLLSAAAELLQCSSNGLDAHLIRFLILQKQDCHKITAMVLQVVSVAHVWAQVAHNSFTMLSLLQLLLHVQ